MGIGRAAYPAQRNVRCLSPWTVISRRRARRGRHRQSA